MNAKFRARYLGSKCRVLDRPLIEICKFYSLLIRIFALVNINHSKRGSRTKDYVPRRTNCESWGLTKESLMFCKVNLPGDRKGAVFRLMRGLLSWTQFRYLFVMYSTRCWLWSSASKLCSISYKKFSRRLKLLKTQSRHGSERFLASSRLSNVMTIWQKF